MGMRLVLVTYAHHKADIPLVHAQDIVHLAYSKLTYLSMIPN